jgi:hypothetical protein
MKAYITLSLKPGPALKISRQKVCNVRKTATTISTLKDGLVPDGQEIPAMIVFGPFSSCRPRFSTNSFIDSFGGKRSMK